MRDAFRQERSLFGRNISPTSELEVNMSRVEQLEQQVQELDPQEFTQFRDWFLELEWDAWDREIERDSKAGKLDALAQKALEDHAAGWTTPL